MKNRITMIAGIVCLSILTACSSSESVKGTTSEEQTTSQSGAEMIKANNGVVSYHGKYLKLAENMDNLEKDAPIIIKATKNPKNNCNKRNKRKCISNRFLYDERCANKFYRERYNRKIE